MSVTGFNPYDSNSWPSPIQEEVPFMSEPTSQPDSFFPVPPPFSPAYEETSDSESETVDEGPQPHLGTVPDEPAIRMTDLKNVRQVLATMTNYNGGQIGNHLKKGQGLIILPLHAVSVLRVPHGRHVGNYKVMVYVPMMPRNHYAHLETFNEAIDHIYSP